MTRSLKRLILILICCLTTSCEISLLPSNTSLRFYDLDISNNTYPENFCDSKSKAKKQILISSIKTDRPYDSYQVYSLSNDGNLRPLKDAQWLAPISDIYPSRISEMIGLSCDNNSSNPKLTTSIHSNSDKIIELTLHFNRINHEGNMTTAESKVSGTLRDEKSGSVIKYSNKLDKTNIIDNFSQKDLINALQKSIINSSKYVLSELIEADID